MSVCLCVRVHGDILLSVRSGGRAVERRTVNRGDGVSIPPTAVSKLRQFRSPHICLCLLEETLKASGPFYLVFMPGHVNDPTQGINVTNTFSLEFKRPAKGPVSEKREEEKKIFTVSQCCLKQFR